MLERVLLALGVAGVYELVEDLFFVFMFLVLLLTFSLVYSCAFKFIVYPFEMLYKLLFVLSLRLL